MVVLGGRRYLMSEVPLQDIGQTLDQGGAASALSCPRRAGVVVMTRMYPIIELSPKTVEIIASRGPRRALI